MYVHHNLTVFLYICAMKDEEIKVLNAAIIKLVSDFEREHGVVIDAVVLAVKDSVMKGIVCRTFSIETSYNEKE